MGEGTVVYLGIKMTSSGVVQKMQGLIYEITVSHRLENSANG
jgi:hypothetical protein